MNEDPNRYSHLGEDEYDCLREAFMVSTAKAFEVVASDQPLTAAELTERLRSHWVGNPDASALLAHVLGYANLQRHVERIIADMRMDDYQRERSANPTDASLRTYATWCLVFECAMTHVRADFHYLPDIDQFVWCVLATEHEVDSAATAELSQNALRCVREAGINEAAFRETYELFTRANALAHARFPMLGGGVPRS